MILFGHIGPSLFAARAMTSNERFNLKAAGMVALFAVLPDVIDKSLFKLGLAPMPTGRLWAHTLPAAAAACLIVYWFAKTAWTWALAFPGHLVLDAMWERPHTLFWPVLGNVFDRGWAPCPADVARQGLIAIQKWTWNNDPLTVIFILVGELAGLVLAYAALRRLLFRRPAPGPERRLYGSLRIRP